MNADANNFSSSGAWHIQALNDRQQSLTVDGVVTFTFEAEPQVGQGLTVITQGVPSIPLQPTGSNIVYGVKHLPVTFSRP